MRNLGIAAFTFMMFVIHPRPSLLAQETERGGQVTGIIQAVLGSGDMKPARFAKVYVIPSLSAVQVIATFDRVRSALDEARKENPDGPGADLVEIECVKALLKLSPSLEKASATLKGKQANADEEGEFDLSLPDSGQCSLIAIGRAGLNAGVWVKTDITVGDTRQKLSKPRLACYDPQTLFKLQ